MTSLDSGQCHNDMLGMASDTVLRWRTLPRLMASMLETDGWRTLVRPIDGLEFENRTIADWVLGEPWPGLHFPNWATVYALLSKNTEVGDHCKKLLKDAGAPTEDEAERAFQVERDKARGKLNANGGDRKKDISELRRNADARGNSQSYLARRLLRDAPEVFEAFERGEHPSIRAAAMAAGLVHKKTALQQLAHWWQKATDDERQQFLDYLSSQRRMTA